MVLTSNMFRISKCEAWSTVATDEGGRIPAFEMRISTWLIPWVVFRSWTAALCSSTDVASTFSMTNLLPEAVGRSWRDLEVASSGLRTAAMTVVFGLAR